MRKVIAALMGSMVVCASAVGISSATTAVASADVCTPDWVLGIGGFTVSGNGIFGQDSTYIFSDQPVGYNSASPTSGLNELNKLFWQHRAECPSDHITIVAHSEGAGIAHAWVSANQGVDNASAVLLADPKREADGIGTNGLAGDGLSGIIGYPLAGVDSNFGSFPVLEVCNANDVICSEGAGWYGYAFQNAHGAYDMNGFDYAPDASGVQWNG